MVRTSISPTFVSSSIRRSNPGGCNGRLETRRSLKDIGSRRRRASRIPFVADLGGRRGFLARSLVQPVAPVRPPAPALLLALREEPIRVRRRRERGDERGFCICRRIDEALQMAAIREY